MKKTNWKTGFSLPLVLIIIALALIVGGVAIYQTQKGSDEQMEEDEAMEMMDDGEEEMMEEQGDLMMDEEPAMEEDAMMEEGSMMKNEDEVMEQEPTSYSGQVIAGSSAKLFDFRQDDFEKAKASDQLVVLYFYANWCPICREEVQNALYPAFNELETDDVIGFRVNFNDSETDQNEEDLAREHGVAYQHSKVFLKNGQRVLRSPESWEKQRYFDEINKF